MFKKLSLCCASFALVLFSFLDAWGQSPAPKISNSEATQLPNPVTSNSIMTGIQPSDSSGQLNGLQVLLATGLDPRISRKVFEGYAPASLPRWELTPWLAPTQAREINLHTGMVLLSPNLQLHPSSTSTQSEMSITTHPLNPDVVMAGANAAHTSVSVVSQGWYYSTDAGTNWAGGDTLPTHTNLSLYMADPAVGIDLDGNLFFNALLYGGTGDLVIARSTNNGGSWTQVSVPNATNGEDKNHLAIDINPGSPFENNLYTAYTDFAPFPSPVMFSRSTNRGVSFTSPVSISGSIGSQFAQGINLAVGPNGELYAAWSGYDSWPPPVVTRLGFNKSTDGGVTWSTAVSLGNVNDIRGTLNKGGNFVRVNSFPSMAVDRSGGSRDGWIYIVYPQKNPTTPDIFLVRSTDGGSTWTSPTKVNQDISGKDQWFSWITVDRVTGALYVVYYDSRNFAANDSAQVYISSSLDGGETFEDVLVSDVPFLPTPIPGLAFGYMGDYIGISALNGVVWPCWNDNRTGIHQAYTSRIVFIEVGSPPKISLSTDTLDFGEVYLGYPETLSFNVRNLGFPETLLVSNIVSDNPVFTPETTSFSIPGGSSFKLKVVCNPAAVGPVSGTLTITSNDTANPTVYLSLQVDGLLPPDISVTPDSLSADLFTGGMVTETLTIANTGFSDLNFDISIGDVAIAASVSVKVNTLHSPPHTDVNSIGKILQSNNRVSSQIQGKSERNSNDASFASPQAPVIKNKLASESKNVLIFRDNLAWGWNVNVPLLEGLGASVSTATSSEMGSINLTQYDLIIFESQQPTSFYNTYINNLSGFESFLISGGVIEFHCATYSSLRVPNLPFPGGMRTLSSEDLDTYNYIADPTHPIVAGATDPLYGNLASHEAFENLPGAAKVIVVNEAGQPTTVEYKVGSGTLIATGMTWEYGYAVGWNSGDPLLPNALQYSLSIALNWISVNPNSGMVPAGNSVNIAVTFDATGLNGGDYYANILISSNDPDEQQVSVPAHLHVTGAPDIALSDDTLSFGTPFIGASVTETLTVSNPGTDLLNVTGISTDHSYYTAAPTVFSLTPGQSQKVLVTFAPTDTGQAVGTLTITSNDPDEPTLNVSLLGEGLLPPDISVSPESLSADLFTGETVTETLTIANTGFSDLNFEVTDERISASVLVKGNSDNSRQLLTTKVLQFNPTTYRAPNPSAGNKLVRDEISNLKEVEPFNITKELNSSSLKILLAMADAGSAFIAGQLLTFPDIASVDIFDTRYGTPTLAMLLNYDAVMAWTNFTPQDPVALGNVLADYVDEGRGVVLGTFSFYSNCGSYSMCGRIMDSSYTPLVSANLGNHYSSANMLILDPSHPIMQGVSNASELYRDYTLLTYGSDLIAKWSDGENFVAAKGRVVAVNSYVGDYYVWTGDIPLILHNSLAFVATDAAWLFTNPDSGTVPAGNTIKVEVTFDATGLNGGDYYANILISSNDPDEPQDTTSVHLHVTGAPDIALSDDTLSFGTVFLGGSPTETLIVSNQGTDLMNISNISSGHTYYTATPANFSLNPGQNQNVLVTFAPTDTGQVNVALTITSNDPDEPAAVVSLLGRGAHPPVISVEPNYLVVALAEGNSAVGKMTVHNSGLGELLWSAIARTPAQSQTVTAKRSNYPQGYYQSLGKGEPDQRAGNPVSSGLGGPDSFGYTWIDSDEPGGPDFNWLDISQTGTQAPGLSDDNYVGPFPIGFPFDYYGKTYTEFYISSNGFIGFGPPTNYHIPYNSPIPDSLAPDNILAWCWDNLYPTYSALLFYQTVANSLVIQFVDYGQNYSGGRVYAEVILRADGSISYQYLKFQNGFVLNQSTIGIEDSTGADGLEVAFNQNYLHDSLAILFSALRWLSVNPSSGTVPGRTDQEVEITLDATGLAQGDYEAHLSVMSNDPILPQVAVRVLLTVSPCEANSGDLSKNGIISFADLVYLANIVLRFWTVPGDKCLADVNGDTKITLVDVIYLRNYMFRNGPTPVATGACCQP